TQHDTKNRHTKSQSHIPTLMHTHKNTYTHVSNVKTKHNGRRTLSHTPHKYYILPGPAWGNQPRTQEVVPFPPGVETGRPPQHLNLVHVSPGSCLNLSDPGLDPDSPHHRPQSPTTSILIRRGGHVQKRGCNHSRHRMKYSQPPNEFRS
ncbi:hypothetical protein GOODEAATRI_013745, partial [Goodea atripinnis]